MPESVLIDAERYIEQGHPRKALATLAPYSKASDPTVRRLQASAQAAASRETLRDSATLSAKQQLALLAEIERSGSLSTKEKNWKHRLEYRFDSTRQKREYFDSHVFGQGLKDRIERELSQRASPNLRYDWWIATYVTDVSGPGNRMTVTHQIRPNSGFGPQTMYADTIVDADGEIVSVSITGRR